MTVTAPDENGPGLTLSQALTGYTSGQNIILFNVPGNHVDISGGSLSVDKNKGPVVIDGGGCSNGQPTLTIDGGPGVNFTLGKGIELRNVRFSGVRLVSSGTGAKGGNKFSKCVVVTD